MLLLNITSQYKILFIVSHTRVKLTLERIMIRECNRENMFSSTVAFIYTYLYLYVCACVCTCARASVCRGVRSFDDWYSDIKLIFLCIITWLLVPVIPQLTSTSSTIVKYFEYCWHSRSCAIFRTVIASLHELGKICEIPTSCQDQTSKLSSYTQHSFFILVCTRVHRNLRMYIRELTLRGTLSSSRCCSLQIRYDFAYMWRVALWKFLMEPISKGVKRGQMRDRGTIF